MKQVMTKRPWACMMPKPKELRALLEKVRASMEQLVPVGYQDSTGFHFGVQYASALAD